MLKNPSFSKYFQIKSAIPESRPSGRFNGLLKSNIRRVSSENSTPGCRKVRFAPKIIDFDHTKKRQNYIDIGFKSLQTSGFGIDSNRDIIASKHGSHYHERYSVRLRLEVRLRVTPTDTVGVTAFSGLTSCPFCLHAGHYQPVCDNFIVAGS